MKTADLILALVVSIPVAAQTSKPATPPVKAPVAPTITDAQKAVYWKAVFQQSSLQKQLTEANTSVQGVVQEMVAACGKDATLTQAQNGDPVCVLKPAEIKPAEKK